MPRPSKRKLASRDNLLKARAKMSQLRSLHMSSEGDDVPQIVGDVLQKGSSAAASAPGSDFGQHLKEIVSGTKLPNENRAIPENKAHVKEEGLNFNQSVHGRMAHKGLLVVDHCLKDSQRGMKMVMDPIPEKNTRQIVVTSEKGAATRPVEQKAKSYLRIYKENYRASKKMKLLSQFSISDGGPWRAEGVSLEERYVATVGG
ncbi:hypothetical protein ACGC1H_006787 [Rhizoctonia solani]